jgi:aminopeptidase
MTNGVPSVDILKKYADVLIKFALWGGKGVKPKEKVCLQVAESAKPMLAPLVQAVLEAGAYPIVHYLPDGHDRWESVDRVFYEYGNLDQITYMPEKYLLERINTCDHFVGILSSWNTKELEGIDSEKIMARQKAVKFYKDARFAKEDAGKLTWTLALFGTEAMAKDANMTLTEYWEQIIKACYLEEADPIAKWQETFAMMAEYQEKLTALKIESVHVTGADVDLTVKIGTNRKWLGGSGRNIPSFELFVSPDWRGTNGVITFNQPLYRFGSLISGIKLQFKDGLIVSAIADQNQQLLQDMIAVEGANKIGEFSLTDSRFSKITKVMANTLYDENIGGEFGNMHLAVGSAYNESYIGDVENTSAAEFATMGFNDSAIHTDIMTTTDRTVEATLADGTKKIIYENGKFTI